MSEGQGAKKGFLANVILNLSPKVGILNRNLENVWRHFWLSQLGKFSSVQSLSCVQPFATDSMNHSTPGLPVHHQLPESTQTHVH